MQTIIENSLDLNRNSKIHQRMGPSLTDPEGFHKLNFDNQEYRIMFFNAVITARVFCFM